MIKYHFRAHKKSDDDKKDPQTDWFLNTANLKEILGGSSDVTFRNIYINGKKDSPVNLCYIAGMADNTIISDFIVKPLIQEKALGNAKNTEEIIDLLEHGAIYFPSMKRSTSLDDIISDILTGSVALIFDELETALTFTIQGFEKRAIEEPTDENVIKGARDAFIEVLRTNTSIVRRKIRNRNLRIKEFLVGRQTKTSVAVCYIEGLTNPDLVAEVIKRIQAIDIDGVLVGNSIESYISDSKFMIFPQMLYTERSDKFCQRILDGRVGILIDGTAISFLVPGTITHFMTATEDFAQNFIISTGIRMVRYISLLTTLLLPAVYIAVTSFHQEMLPADLAASIAASKLGVPFPVYAEAILMIIAFEILLEAGLRLPKPIGQTVSIVGAVVVGQAAIMAKIISPAVVIVIATTAITGFTIPSLDFANALRIWRLIFVLAASLAGLFGIVIIYIIATYILCTREVFGVAYLSPFVENNNGELFMDTFIRIPLWFQKKRPPGMQTVNQNRQK